MASVVTDVQRFVFSVRNAIGRADMKAAFVTDYVGRMRDLHRNNQREFDAQTSVLLKVLETLQLTGGNPNEIACALTTLAILLHLELTSAQLSQCNSTIRVCLMSATDFVSIVATAKLLGESIAISGPNDFVRKAIDDAMIWINLTEARSETRKVGGLAVLSEVVERVPVLFIKYLPDFFERIWTPLSDSTPEVREGALSVFKIAVKIANARDKPTRVAIFATIFNKLRSALSSKNVEQNIGGLYAFEYPVMAAREHDDCPKYEDIFTMIAPVINLTNNNSGSSNSSSSPATMRILLFRVLAVMCKFNPGLFTTSNLKTAVNFGLEYTKKESDRPFAFRMLADIIKLVKGPNFEPYLDQTIVAIKQVFILQKRAGKPPVWEALECLAVICNVCPSKSVEAHVSSCIEHVFGYGLSTQLIDCMRDIVAASSPQARLKLEESMLDLISLTLCGLPFRHHARADKINASSSDLLNLPVEVTDEQIEIALDALLKFGFSNSEQLGDFLREAVLPFVDSERRTTRTASVRTITSLLIPASSTEELTFSRRICVDLVVTKLLVIGCSDNDPSIRRLIFSSFTSTYFPFLVEPQFLFQVCNALGDEELTCRVAVIELLCGMMDHNPSHILPVLRKEVIKQLQTIATTDHAYLIEQSLKVLSSIAQKAPEFARTFHSNVMSVVTPLLNKSNQRTTYLPVLLECLVNVCIANMYTAASRTQQASTSTVVTKSIELLHLLSLDRSTQATRIHCVQLLGALMRPTFGGLSPYQCFPSLYKVLSTIIRNKEECIDIRMEALKTVGRIGALDPHQFTELEISDGSAINRVESVFAFGKISAKKCAGVVLHAMALVLDPRNARVAGGSESLLRTAVKTILLICERSCGSHEELHIIFNPLCALMRTLAADSRLFFTVLYQLADLVTMCGPNSLDHLDCFEDLAKSLWTNVNARFLVVRICTQLALLEGSNEQTRHFTSYFSRLMPIMLDSLDTAENDYYRRAVLDFLLRSQIHLQPFIYRICMALLEVLEDTKTSTEFASQVIVVLRQLAVAFPLHEMIPPMIRCLLSKMTTYVTTTSPVPTESSPLVSRILSLLRVLVVQQQGDFSHFAPDVLRCLKSLRLNNQELVFMCMQACRGGTSKILLNSKTVVEMEEQTKQLEELFSASFANGLGEYGEIWGSSASKAADVNDCEPDVILPINEAQVVERCKLTPSNSKEEWIRWFEELSKVIIREAPYHIFRCISTSPGVNSPSLIDRAPEFVQDVLNIAFRCLYYRASFPLRNAIAECFNKVIGNNNAPDDVVSMILSIVEYMDIIGNALPIDPANLAQSAGQKGMLAKALYWREASYKLNPEECVQELITVYSSLNHKDSAVGLLNAQSKSQGGDNSLALQHGNLIKLGKFAEALELMQRENPSIQTVHSATLDTDSIFRSSLISATTPSIIRPRHARTRSLSTVSDSENSFAHMQDTELAKKLELEVNRVKCLSELGDMHSVLTEWRILQMRLRGQQRPDDDEENNLLNIVAPFAADAAIRLKSWEDLSDATPWIPKETIQSGTAQAVLGLTKGLFDEAQQSVVHARRLLLEEITGLMHESYARAFDGIVAAQQLVELEESISTFRLTDVQLQQEQKREITRVWNERISRTAQSIGVWKRILSSRGILVPPNEDVATRILFVKLCREFGGSSKLERFTLEQMLGCRSPAYDQLIDPATNPRVVFEYITHLSSCNELNKYAAYGDERSIITKLLQIHGGKSENRALEARMHARRGYGAEVTEAIDSYQAATECDPGWFRGWRFWAEANIKYLETRAQTTGEATEHTVVNAIRGFIKSVELAPTTSNALQDVLKLLSLWSRHADTATGLQELERRMFDIPLSVWQLVIPQLIARLDSGSDDSCRLTAKVISAVANEHPQSLIYPLNVCTTSTVKRRQQWANQILSEMEKKFPRLVAQGKLVSTELIRIASLIYEQWHEAFENAASAFFGRRDSFEMLEVMLPAHDGLKKAPETLVEVEFHAKYHRLLEEAKNWLRSFSFTNKISDLHTAWNIYHAIYKQIDEQLKSSKVLSMQYCSPRLWEARNLELTIPDARPREGRETIRIASFDSTLTVIASKQRPKRIAIQGTDGKAHKFLLKGHEDLRLDERVMQLFKLVNTLLLANHHTSKVAGYQIQRYSVTPLWDTVGLIGWVDECDTMHQLIHSYREERGIEKELELGMMPRIITLDHAKAYDYLTVMSKVEVLEFLWDHSSGHDIRKAMWTASLNCETWLERRKTFTTSLATMSVVGYILGLGDRHPNNIMIQRSTGKVVHIDFGDCFEVAMTRDRFPEKIPFRLTRMLQNALEVCGVDGRYRAAAETVMTALRDNKDSLLAMLTAFVQDPLISWRLVKRPGDDPVASAEMKTINDNVALVAQDQSGTDEDSPLMPLVPISDDDDLSALEVSRRVKVDQNEGDRKANEAEVAHQGVAILTRLASKLRGQEFTSASRRRMESKPLDPRSQVSKLISEATDITNLAQSWSGWYPFW